MKIDLGLDKRIDEVFSEYEERIVDKAIVFEGTLLPQNARASDSRVILFLSGGSRYVSYELERDGAYVKGWIRYRSAAKSDPKGINLAITKMEEAIGQAPKKRPKTRAASDKVKNPKKPGKKRAADDELAKKMQDMYKAGATQVSLAKRFDINKKTVCLIVNKKGAYAE